MKHFICLIVCIISFSTARNFAQDDLPPTDPNPNPVYPLHKFVAKNLDQNKFPSNGTAYDLTVNLYKEFMVITDTTKGDKDFFKLVLLKEQISHFRLQYHNNNEYSIQIFHPTESLNVSDYLVGFLVKDIKTTMSYLYSWLNQ